MDLRFPVPSLTPELWRRRTPLLALAHRIWEHENGTRAFVNAVAAEFGWRSRIGRIVDDDRLITPRVGLFLVLASLKDLEGVAERPTTLSPAAAAMMEHAHAREGRRLRPCPPCTRAAVFDYLNERLELYRTAEPILWARRERMGAEDAHWQVQRLARVRRLLLSAWVDLRHVPPAGSA